MKPFCTRLLSLLTASPSISSYSCLLFLLFGTPALCQHTISIQIDQAQVSTTCTDLIGTPDPVWEVNIENEGWVTYGDAACFTDLPYQQFSTNVDCISDMRGGEIQVCFKVYENDPGFSPCKIDGECEVSICDYFVLPLNGQDSTYQLSIPNNEVSSGALSFTINIDGTQNGATNDHICHAINLGTLTPGNALGKSDLITYNNYCATATNEVNPKDFQINGSFTNNVGTWFMFNTGDNPSELIVVEALSDPEETGDFLSLQLALYQAENDACTGTIKYITDHHDPADHDEYMILECLPPNQTYYILVDGVYDETTLPELPLLHGVFSLQVREKIVLGENDQICDAIPLAIEEGATASYYDFFNNCATNINDPSIQNFPSIQPVWFQFHPPPSRRVEIEVIGNLPFPNGIDPIEPQIAVFEAQEGDCANDLKQIGFHYNSESSVNTIELDCLDPAKTYWMMVDGNTNNPTGVFDIAITDLGYPAISQLDTIICKGAAFQLGNQSYTTVGTYLDTIVFEGGCLEIIETTIRVADSIAVEMAFPKLSGNIDVSDGTAEVLIEGGSGNYTISWEDGSTTSKKENLTGGKEYCVLVSDVIGCSRNICFTMPYVVPIKADLTNDTLDCYGDSNGQLLLEIEDGRPPYQYTLHNANKQILKTGKIEEQATTLLFKDLVAGDYTLIVNTANAVNTLLGKVRSPSAIEVSVIEQLDASCFNACDAGIRLLAEGGNGDFDFNWKEGADKGPDRANLCAAAYQITVTDQKNCSQTIDFELTEPAEFVAKAIQTKSVQCYGENDGIATVSTNGNPIQFAWDNGITESINSTLAAGIHNVVVTNSDNCIDTAFVEILQPESAIETTIEVIATLNCFGDSNGLLKGSSIGGNGDYSYLWNNNNTAALNDNLTAGNYTLTVTDQLGCTAISTYQLGQPEALSATFTSEDVTCPGGPTSGVIGIDNIAGGVAPYAYRLSDTYFSDSPLFDRLRAGTYEVFVQDANGCEIKQTTTVNDPPLLEVDLGADQTIKLGQLAQLEALSNRPVRYEWEGPTDINCENCSTIDLQPFNSAKYRVTVTDLASECTATDEVFLAINKDRSVFVPNVFSPNGDGINDVLVFLGGNDIRTIKAFKIFDRKGSLVYEANNFSPNDPSFCWKGDFNGQRLSPAVFIYWAEVEFIDGYSDIFKGDVAIMK